MFLMAAAAYLPFCLLSVIVYDAWYADNDDDPEDGHRPTRILDSLLQYDRSLVQESLRRYIRLFQHHPPG